MATQTDVVSYLASIKGAKIIRLIPCNVAIGRKVYPAARYIERLATPENSPAWRRGEREYEREMVYCVGFLPSAKLRGNVAFVSEAEPHEWYVAGYYGNVRDRKQEEAVPNEFNPFGNSFLLAPWNLVDGSKIDQHERVPYRRVPFAISNRFSDV